MAKRKKWEIPIMILVLIVVGVITFFATEFLQTALGEPIGNNIPVELGESYGYQEDFGGEKIDCGSKYYTTGGRVYSSAKPETDHFGVVLGNIPGDFVAGDGSVYDSRITCFYSNRGDCNIGGSIIVDYKNPESFLETRIIQPQNLFEKTINTINVTIDSPKSFQVKLWMYLRKTGINGFEYRDLTRNVALREGLNNFEVVLPTDLQVSEYELVVIPTSLMNYEFVKNYQDSCSNCQGGADSSVSFGKCNQGINFLRLSPIIVQKFLISPIPIWKVVGVGESCGVNYVPQVEDDKVCVRDDLKNLGCFSLGCPITVDPVTSKTIAYECTSSGLCAEPIYKVADKTECTSSQVYDENTGACVDKVIYANIVQCDTSSDCYNPCPEQVRSMCKENKCEYSGECKPLTVEVVKVVEKLVTKELPVEVVKETGVMGVTPPKKTGLVSFFEKPIVIIGMLLIIASLVLSLFLWRKKR